jgi:LCP family protein required for cell wall assembly
VPDPVKIAWPLPFTYGNATPPPTPIPQPAPALALDPEAINILLLGSDRRPTWKDFRTDVVILVSIQPKRGNVVMLSIPRDLYVYLPGYSMQRVNMAFYLGEKHNYPGGGPAMLADTILYNLGIPVDAYAMVEMTGLEGIVDALDGIEVNVACPYTDWRLKSPNLNPQDPDNWRLYTVYPGVKKMDGEMALWYSRSRKKSSDFDRSRRQQEVLRATYRQIQNLDLLLHLPELYDQTTRYVQTDLDLDDLIKLAPLTARFSLPDVRSHFLGKDEVRPWRVPTSGAAVQLPRPTEVYQLLNAIFSVDALDNPGFNDRIEVEVVNASNREDLAVLAAERLIYAGYDAFVSGIEESIVDTTVLIDFGLEDEVETEALMRELGLASSRLVLSPEPSSRHPYQLLVGNDYDPCFNPTRDQLDPP